MVKAQSTVASSIYITVRDLPSDVEDCLKIATICLALDMPSCKSWELIPSNSLEGSAL